MRKNTYSDKKAGVDDRNGKDAVNIEPKFPSWFSKKCLTDDISETPQALSQYLNACRQGIYSAASLYHDQIKYTTTVLVALITAMIAIFSFLKVAGVTSSIVRNIELAGAVLMVVAVIIGSFSLKIIGRYHKLYIATLLYATEVHHFVEITGFQWFEEIIEHLRKEYRKNILKNKEISREDFIQSRSRNRKYGHFWYIKLIWCLILLCGAAAILLVFCAPFSSC
ncbi:MAG: hypothetical protein KAT65_14585 [Methanophagales archaeon]|nr:hypothetical protein [Methanophagales archaeon]